MKVKTLLSVLAMGWISLCAAGAAASELTCTGVTSTDLPDQYRLTIFSRKFEHITASVPYPTRKVEITVPKNECADIWNCTSDNAVITKTSINDLRGSWKVEYASKLENGIVSITVSTHSLTQTETFSCNSDQP